MKFLSVECMCLGKRKKMAEEKPKIKVEGNKDANKQRWRRKECDVKIDIKHNGGKLKHSKHIAFAEMLGLTLTNND